MRNLFQKENSEESAFRARFQAAHVPHLSPDAKNRMKSLLLAEFASVTHLHPDRYRNHKINNKSFIFQPMMIPIIAAIVILLGGSVGTVVASDNAKPGDALFGIDQASENVHVFLSFSDTAKAKVKAEIAEEREEERVELESEGRSDDALEAEEHADNALVNAIETISRVRLKMQEKGNTEAEQALAEVEAKLISLRTLRDQRNDEDEQDEQSGLSEVEVKIQNNTAQVKLEMNDAKSMFVLQTTDEDAIIQEVANRTGATIAEVEAVIHFEVEDDEDTNENVNGNTNSNDEDEDETNENENENVNADKDEDEGDDDADETNTNANANRSENSNRNTNENTNSSGEREDEGIEIRVEVKLEDGTAEIKTKVAGSEQEWELNTTNQNTILLSISAKTGLATSAIEAIWEYSVED